MKKLLLGVALLASMSSFASGFKNCTKHLYENTTMLGTEAANYCLQNTSPEFINCTVDLYKNTTMLGRDAADLCIKLD